jgi:hypothetical protein
MTHVSQIFRMYLTVRDAEANLLSKQA